MSVNKSIEENLENIRSLIVKRKKFNEKQFRKSLTLKRRRKENTRRRANESALEASNLVKSFSGRIGLTKIAGAGKDLLGRILKFMGYLAAGWLLNNLPTLIGYGQEFLARAEKFKEIAVNIFDSVKGIFTGMKDLIVAAFTNLKEFDFNDSQGRLNKAWEEITKEFNSIAGELDESAKLLTTPLIDEEGKGAYSGQVIPPFGSTGPDAQANTGDGKDGTSFGEGTYGQGRPPDPKPAVITGSGAVPGAGLAIEWRALLDVIAFAEGTFNQPNNGYNTHFGFDQTEDLSKHPNIVKRTPGYASAAFGRYQFMPRTWIGLGGACAAGGNIPETGGMNMSPSNQDKGAVTLCQQRGVTLQALKSMGFSREISAALSPEWASIPNVAGRSTYGQPVKRYETLKNLYDSKVKASQTAKTQPQSTMLPNLPPTNTLEGQNYGASRDQGARRHAGQDFDAGPNDTFYSRIGGKVVRILKDSDEGYGNYVDIYNKKLGVTERIAEGSENLVSVGDKVQPGTPIQRGTHQTGVFHYEIRKGGSESYGFEGTMNPLKYLDTLTPVRQGTKIIMVKKSQMNQQSPPIVSESGLDLAEDNTLSVVNRLWKQLVFDKLQQ